MKTLCFFVILQITSVFCCAQSQSSKSSDSIRLLSPEIVSDDTRFSKSSLIACLGYSVGDDRSESFKRICVKLATDKKLGSDSYTVNLLFNGEIYKPMGSIFRAQNKVDLTYTFLDIDFSYADLSEKNKNIIVYVTTKNK